MRNMAVQALLSPTNFQPFISVCSLKFCPKLMLGRPPVFLSKSKKKPLRLEASLAKVDENIQRRQADFPPTPWKDTDFFISNHLLQLEFEEYDNKIDELEEEVKEMLTAPTKDLVEKVSLIDSICRLGVSHHFVNEIEEQLSQIFEAQPNLAEENDNDLYTVALLFRVLRQHGYKISSDVFKKFMDDDGNFKEILSNDVRGLLSLYEAAHLRLNDKEDHILEDALSFTIPHLSSLATKSSLHLKEHIIDEIRTPSHKAMQRYEAHRYIPFYQEEESRNETLLMFAKLDFNKVQLLHQQELSHCISWWKELNLTSKLPYVRDRIVEIYFFVLGLYYKPCYSNARIICTKIIMLLTCLDDTYDSYGTIDELQRFTDALERWDTSTIDELPDYMKILYTCFVDLFDQLNNDIYKEGVSYAKDAVKENARAYMVEVRWFNEGYVPTFDEYLNNGIISIGCMACTAAAFIGMEETANARMNPFQWMLTKPKIIIGSYTIARLRNDVASSQFEQERGHVASGVECYMKQHGVSRHEAKEKLMELCENAWKDINEECMKPTDIPVQFLDCVANCARATGLLYSDGRDGLTKPEHITDNVNKLLIEKIPI